MQVNNAIRESFEAEMLLAGYSKGELARRPNGKFCLATMNDKFEGFVLGRETLESDFPTETASVYGVQTEIAKPAQVREFLKAQGVRV